MEKKSNRSAVDWVDMRGREDEKYKAQMFRTELSLAFAKAVWVDANTEGGCVVDPSLFFHFYQEEDAVAFKLRWE